MFDEDRQIDTSSRHGDEIVAQHTEIAAYEREQIGRLGEGVAPNSVMTFGPGNVARFDRIAVG